MKIESIKVTSIRSQETTIAKFAGLAVGVFAFASPIDDLIGEAHAGSDSRSLGQKGFVVHYREGAKAARLESRLLREVVSSQSAALSRRASKLGTPSCCSTSPDRFGETRPDRCTPLVPRRQACL